MFDFSIVTSWVHELLTSFMPLGLAIFIECVIVGLCILLMYVVVAILMIFMERKVCAAFQCRLGPMRVGPWGTLQVFADVFKMLTKEIITIRRSDKFLYNLAPYIVILASVLAFSCLPFNKGMEILDFNVGVFFMMAASSIGIVGILLAGWSSNNKYSLIGAMRSGAQMISYELSIGLSILTIIVLTDTMQFSEIVARQADGWFIFKGHIPAMIAFVIYLIAGNAEVNRGPFDLPEAESELTAGYHTEYSGMHFGLFYVAEFVNLFIIAGVASTIFLGGWMPLHISGWEGFNTVMDYSGLRLVLRQDALRHLAADVDQMDLPAPARGPDSDAGVEIPGTDRAGQSAADGRHRRIQTAFLSMANYIQGLFHGIRTLLTGLKVTGKEFVTPKITEQYPENRATLKMNERFCGTLTMPHDAEGKNKCVACGLCQAACPNGTIKITTETVTDEETGKPRRRLVKYEYDLGACMFCHLCVNACPHDAIRFDTAFEHAVYTRDKLVKTLNK